MIIFGTGSMARLLDSHMAASVFVADDKHVLCDSFRGCPLVKFSDVDEYFGNNPPRLNEIIIAIGYHEMNSIRASRYEDFKRKGYTMRAYIGPDIGRSTIGVGTGCVIYENTTIHLGTRIDENVFISSGVNIGHDCRIGHSAWINAGVAIGGGVTIGDRCVIGMNATIAHGVTLGPRTFVGANTLVTSSTNPDSVVMSQPGKLVPDVDSTRYLKLLEASRLA